MDNHRTLQNSLSSATQYSDINHSWKQIAKLGTSIQNTIDTFDRHNALQLVQRRQQLINRHFKQFPIGPQTANFYTSRISHFFKQEEELTALMHQKRNVPLYLVK